jgi:hypothetical protein
VLYALSHIISQYQFQSIQFLFSLLKLHCHNKFYIRDIIDYSWSLNITDSNINFTLISALGPSHCPRRPFGPKNECLDKVSLFGSGRFIDLQSPENNYHISSFNTAACFSFEIYLDVQDRTSSNHEDNRNIYANESKEALYIKCLLNENGIGNGNSI